MSTHTVVCRSHLMRMSSPALYLCVYFYLLKKGFTFGSFGDDKNCLGNFFNIFYRKKNVLKKRKKDLITEKCSLGFLFGR